MGWTGMQKPQDVRGYLASQLTFENGGRKHRCLDVAIVGRTEAYAAVETTDEDGVKKVWAVVWALRFNPKSADGCDFMYKDMTEDMGPVQKRCPARILDLLTPTDGANANEWRQACRARLERRKKASEVREGDYLRLPAPIRFESGAETDTFRVEVQRWGRGNRTRFRLVFPDGTEGGLGRIPEWRDMEFEKLEPDEVPGAAGNPSP